MQDILDLIIFCILFAFIWHIIMNSQRYAYEDLFDEDEENLTMEENPIKITIENYKEQTIQFTMPPDTPVSVLRGTTSDRFNYLNISVVGGDTYTIEEEQF